ncbi:unnamed protein product [Lymnaea stagnalis]|uniref:RNA-polymerase II-associated protein 3-like C-terminal domain-containing protein n=1 Tax=Lymnaea stagnalis TaxID=6523 RepID=A0AAV2HUE8_LYMST
MTSNFHIEGQSTKKYDIPLSHMEYSYIEKCSNVKELEKIYRVLRSGDEGKFPDLEKFTENRIQALNPKSRVLRHEGPILRPGDLSSGDWNQIDEDLKIWTTTMNEKEKKKSGSVSQGPDDILEGDENLPPVRSNNTVLEGKKQKKNSDSKKTKVMPRDYREWDKIDIDAELSKIDSDENKKTPTNKTKINGVNINIETAGLSQEEKELKANREKDKGNEAFRAKEFEESVTYYSRSITLIPTAASYNNRALAYLKLEKWDKAIMDCDSVLNLEADNIKALLRRGTAYKSKKSYTNAVSDFEKVLKMEANNKTAEGLLQEVQRELQKEKKEKGRRMVIEEVEEADDKTEEKEIDKNPVINGHGPSCDVGQTALEINTKMKTEETTNTLNDSVSASVCQESQEKASDSEDKSTTCRLATESQTCEQSCSELKDNTTLCSNTSSEVPYVVTSTSEENNALSSTNASETLVLQSSSKVSFSLEETSESSQAAQEAAQQMKFNNAHSNQFTRPHYVQFPLPSDIQQLKENGNTFFRSGQYGDAIEQYSKAIKKLEKEPDQNVNLSVLLSNQAACYLKTGNCSQAVSECSRSLELVPHSAKALLRRATAYEHLEKYADAYIDYKHVISIDKTADQAHQGAARCQSVLQKNLGPKWRQNIPSLVFVQPWEIPLIVDQGGMHESLSSSTSLADKDGDSAQKSLPSAAHEQSVTSTIQNNEHSKTNSTAGEGVVPPENDSVVKSLEQNCAAPELSKEQECEELKTLGNQHVQKGQYQEAVKCYSSSITLCPDQIACYTNRALCFLKLQMAAEAAADCDKALNIQADNPKALYRRALARKMLLQYKASLQDLIELLKLEPKNSAAQKEMNTVKQIYKEELEKLRAKKSTSTIEQETKVRKRMKIEEVEDDDEEEKPRGKTAEKAKLQSKSRNVKVSQPSSGSKSKSNNNTEKKSVHTEECSRKGQSVAPPIAPRLMKTTPYEFCQAWNSLKSCQGSQPYAEILRQVSPIDLPKVISNKLDGQMLQIIVRCVYEEMVLKGENDLGYQILDNLCKVPRFSTVSMFMTSKEKKEVSAVLDILSKTTSSAYTSSNIVRLKKEYSVK